jgi:hypothetical protein
MLHHAYKSTLYAHIQVSFLPQPPVSKEICIDPKLRALQSELFQANYYGVVSEIQTYQVSSKYSQLSHQQVLTKCYWTAPESCEA